MSACAQQGEGVFGIPEDETGLVVTGITFTNTAEKVKLTNKVGNTVGKAWHDCRVEMSVDAGIPNASPNTTWLLGAAVTLANSIPFRLPTGLETGGTTTVEDSTETWSGTDYQKINFNLVYNPFIPSS